MTFILPSIGGGIIASPTAPPTPAYSNQYSLLYDGTNDLVETGYAPGASSGFSISMWIKSTNLTQSMAFASNGASAGSPGGFQVLSVANGSGASYDKSFYILVKNSGGSTSVNNSVGGFNARADICDGNWHHLCVTINGTSVKIYKDGGDAAGSGNTQGTPFATWTAGVAYDGNTGNPYYLGRNGAYAAPANYWMDGNQDEVSMFEYELSGSQVSDIYNNGVPKDISSLSPTLWYRMGENDGGVGTTVTDQGSGGNDGNLTNGATFSADVPLAPLVLPSITNSHALSFNGSTDYVSTAAGTLGLTSASAMTLSFWFKSNTAGEGPSIGSRTGFANQWGFLRTGGVNYVQVVTQSHGKYFTYSSPSDTDYHHYLLTFSAGTLVLYIDGSVVPHSATNTGNGAATTLHAVNVGFNIGRNDTFYSHGLMDEVSVFGTALSQREVTAIYNSGTPNDISSLSPFGWWRCGDDEGGTGTTIANQGNKSMAVGTVHGAAFTTDVPTSPAYSSFSGSFDGTNDYAITSGTPIDQGDMANGYTFSGWMWRENDPNLASNGGTTTWLGGAYASAAGSEAFPQLRWYLTDEYFAGAAYKRIRWYHGSKTIDNTSILIPKGVWAHLAVTWDGVNTVTTFLNGSQIGQITNSGSLVNRADNMMIGKGNFIHEGLVDEVAYWNSELSDITAIYNSGVAADLSSYSPVGWWRMGDNNSGSGTTITDQGSGGNDATMLNGASFSTNVPT